jgi:hypothetical protein
VIDMRLYVLCTISLAACAFEPGGLGEPVDEGTPDPGITSDVDAAVVEPPPVDAAEPTILPDAPPPPPTVNCRLDGENLGIDGARVRAGLRTYTFTAWTRNAAGAPIGFTLDGPQQQLRYEVRAGGERHTMDALVYEGTGVITRVDFCLGEGFPGGGDN